MEDQNISEKLSNSALLEDGGNSHVERSDVETKSVERNERDRERKREYYYNHRDKLEQKRRAKAAIQAAKQCEEFGLPTELAPFVKFYAPTKYKQSMCGLRFDSHSEMINFLYTFKYKSDHITRQALEELLSTLKLQELQRSK